MGCINYGTTPIEVENVEKREQAKEQANIDPGLLGESLKEQAKEQANIDPGLLGESLKES